MQVKYSLSQSQIIARQPTEVDLIIGFQAETDSTSVLRRPLNLSLVLDRSGSMAGYALRYAVRAAQELVEYLTAQDYLSVVAYDDNVTIVLPSQPVEDKAAVKAAIAKIHPGGLTNLSGGWLQGFDQAKLQQSSERINRVLLLTDGQANVGITDPQVLINTAKDRSEAGITTTTLGFNNYFNEDLLIGIADAAGGNFYFIQSPDDATDVFRIEMESLVAVAAQNLTVSLQPEAGVEIQLLNSYTVEDSKKIILGDVYGVEGKPLALQLSLPAFDRLGEVKIATVNYSYQAIENKTIKQFDRQIDVKVEITDDSSLIKPNPSVIGQASQLRIARQKEMAIAAADGGDYRQAAEILRQAVAQLKLKALEEYFEIAEEIEQLDYYAQKLAQKRFDNALRKEMRDQAYQAKRRDRQDLQQRGVTGDAADSLEVVREAGDGVVVKCDRINGKLRIRVVSEGYDPEMNVQFPRSIRQEGATYVVDEIQPSANGTFYRAVGNISRLLKPGETLPTTASTRSRNLQKAKPKGTLADLEVTDTVGDGVLVQCIKEKSKLRARVVSDGYDPNLNMRFPRDIRAEGVLYVVDEVKPSPKGDYYMAYGTIRRLQQN